ncbi:BON domain-containing protein [Oryzifoliimicrobium ureilyticus]|uniref:BON domain-containing protein n=1 Tax=Oryzifoliimicrobium ureilyticus TaxID=3113724 RepID=UPI0030761FCA
MQRAQALVQGSHQAMVAQCQSHLRLLKKQPSFVCDDFDIETAVEAALVRAEDLDCAYIFVSAKGAIVTLSGWVASESEITISAGIATNVPGVQSVHNHLSRSL